MKKIFFCSALLMAGLMTSCKDESVSEYAGQESEAVEDIVYSIRLTDVQGNEVTSLDGDFTVLYAEVEAQGHWCLSTENSNFVYLTEAEGQGNGTVPVYISSCWAGSRKFSIEATPRSFYLAHGVAVSGSRADENPSATTHDIEQTQPMDISQVADRLSSNLGAGYSLSIANTDNMLLMTQMQLFDFAKMKQKGYIKDDVSPNSKQTYIESNSKASLMKEVAVGINGSMDSGSLSGSSISGDVWVGDNSDTTSYYAVRRQITSYFTRDVEYANAVADSCLSPGFKMMRDTLENRLLGLMDLKQDSDSWWKNKRDSLLAVRYVDEFIREVGPNFIKKASMGCVLDYYIKIDSSKIEDGFSVKAVLDLKYDSQVNDESKKKDSTSFTGGLDVSVIDKATKAAASTEVEVVVSGGNTQLIDILCNGGSLDVREVKEWQQSVLPQTAVMNDMELVPISALFVRMEVKNFIFEHLVARGLTKKR